MRDRMEVLRKPRLLHNVGVSSYLFFSVFFQEAVLSSRLSFQGCLCLALQICSQSGSLSMNWSKICVTAVMLLLRNSVESSLTGVPSFASEAVNSLWMHCSAISQSLLLAGLAMRLQRFLNIVLINTL